MNQSTKPAYVGPTEIMQDWAVSKATAYNIIRKMNTQLKREHPSALIIAGKVNRVWYEEACLQTGSRKETT